MSHNARPQSSDFSVTEVQSEMVAAAESKRQPEPQTSSIESVQVVTAEDAIAPGRTLDDNMTSIKLHFKPERVKAFVHEAA